MRKVSLLCCVFCLIVNTLMAANDEWKSGYIVRLSGDTVRGILSYRGGIEDAESCKFRADEESEVLSYRPGEISAYGYDSTLCYRTKHFVTNRFDRLVFAQSLLEGQINLYYVVVPGELYKPQSGGSRKGNEINDYKAFVAELPSGRMIDMVDPDCYPNLSREQIMAEERNAKILENILGEYAYLSSSKTRGKYNRSHMIDLFSRYHFLACGEETCVTYQEKRVSHHFYITPSVGGSVFLSPQTKKNMAIPGGWLGVAFGMNLDPFTERWRANLELGVMPFYGPTYLFDEVEGAAEISCRAFAQLGVEYRILSHWVEPLFEFAAFYNILMPNSERVIPRGGWGRMFGFLAGVGAAFRVKEHSIPVRLRVTPLFVFIKPSGHIVPRIFTLSVGYTFKY